MPREMFEDRMSRKIEDASRAAGRRVRSFFRMKERPEPILKAEDTPRSFSAWEGAVMCAAVSTPIIAAVHLAKYHQEETVQFMQNAGHLVQGAVFLGIIAVPYYLGYRLIKFLHSKGVYGDPNDPDHHVDRDQPTYRTHVELNKDGFTVTREKE